MENILSNAVYGKVKEGLNLIATFLRLSYMKRRSCEISLSQKNNWIEACIRFSMLNAIANHVMLNIIIVMVYSINLDYHGFMCILSLLFLMVYKGMNTTLCNGACNIFRMHEFKIESVSSLLICMIMFIYIIVCRQITNDSKHYFVLALTGQIVHTTYDLYNRISRSKGMLDTYDFEKVIKFNEKEELIFNNYDNIIGKINLKDYFITVRMSIVDDVTIPKIFLYDKEFRLIYKYILNPEFDVVICIGKVEVITSIKFGTIVINYENIERYI